MAAKNKSATFVLLPPAAARCPPWRTAVRSAHTIPTTAPPAPSLPETTSVASACRNAQTRLPSPKSAVSSVLPDLYPLYPRHQWISENLFSRKPHVLGRMLQRSQMGATPHINGCAHN